MEIVVLPEVTYVMVSTTGDPSAASSPTRDWPQRRADLSGLLDRPLERFHRQRAVSTRWRSETRFFKGRA